jgi:ABC-type amino acid transport system permease subunit
MRLIILPQALKLVIPGIVNTFIGLFKDTTLVLIIGLFDLLGIVQRVFRPELARLQRRRPACLSPRSIFWIFCFGMSRYSMFMERVSTPATNDKRTWELNHGCQQRRPATRKTASCAADRESK